MSAETPIFPKTQEGALNSSSNNSKFKNLDELKARMAAKTSGFSNTGAKNSGGGFGGFGGAKLAKRPQQQVIIEEEELNNDPGKLFDFDMNQSDAGLMPPKDNTKPAMAVAIGIVCIIFGAFIGWCWQGVLADRSNVNNRIKVAQQFEPTVQEKADKFLEYTQQFKQRSESLGAGVLEFNADFFENVIKKHGDYHFVLDISSDLPDNTIVLASNAGSNPLADIRGFAAGTTLLSEVLNSHIEETEADMNEIKALLGKSSATDRNIVYALKIPSAEMLSLVSPQSVTEKDYNRLAKAITTAEVFQVKRAITNDEEASKEFAKLVENGTVPADQVKSRTYDAAADAKAKAIAAAKRKKKAKPGQSDPVEATLDNALTLPSRLLYVIEDNSGRQQTVFADEIILIERSKLFAGSANALERYRKRMIQILALLGEIEKTTDGLTSRVLNISTEEPL